MHKVIKIPKHQVRHCNECGKECWGFKCRECYAKNRRGQLTRRRCQLERWRKKQKVKNE